MGVRETAHWDSWKTIADSRTVGHKRPSLTAHTRPSRIVKIRCDTSKIVDRGVGLTVAVRREHWEQEASVVVEQTKRHTKRPADHVTNPGDLLGSPQQVQGPAAPPLEAEAMECHRSDQKCPASTSRPKR